MEKIFIQIASYRDPELLPTLRDCINKSKYPQNLVFSISWQHNEEDEWDNLDEFEDDDRFKIIDIQYNESEGACWARNLLQQQYDGETYTLQLDSHHRFEQDWDEQLIDMLKDLQSRGYKKPLITGYVAAYDATTEHKDSFRGPLIMCFDQFTPDGVVLFLSFFIDDDGPFTEPIPADFYAAGFCFTLGQFCIEVPHDPNYYFYGEEISIAARAYTHGYDLFHPHKSLLFHLYTREKRSRQWDDNPDWWKRNEISLKRNRILFGMESGNIDFGIFGFGSERSLKDYEDYTGLNFKERRFIAKNP